MIERDDNMPDFSELLCEINHAKRLAIQAAKEKVVV